MDDKRDRTGHRSPLAVIIGALLALVVLLFLPPLLSVAEEAFVGTDYVQSFCRALGIHGFLSRIYEGLGDFFF